MKTTTTQQEIILINNTHFSSRDWVEKDTTGPQQPKPYNEKLMEACWNGLLWELLPELQAHAEYPKKMFLWQVIEARNCFILELGETGMLEDKGSSIDPYYFLPEQSAN